MYKDDYLPPARNGTPTKGRWGWVDGDDRHCRQVISLPPTARIVPSAQRTMGVVSNDAGSSRKIIAAGPIPPGRRGNVTAIKDDGDIELTRPIIEKLSLQDLYPRYPPGRRGTGLRPKDDGGGWSPRRSGRNAGGQKIIAKGPIPPPWRGEESFHVEEDVGAALKSILYSAVLWTYTMVLAIQTKP
jgi:hypothetical protein